MMKPGEWCGGDAASRLHVQIHLCDVRRAEELYCALDIFDGDLSWDSNTSQFHIVSDHGAGNDSFLLKLDSVIDSFNRNRIETEKAEILETCLVPEDLEKSDQFFQSRFQIKSYTESEQNPDSLFIEADRSFGTGTHPSTRLVLHFLEHCMPTPFPQKVLDVGCGSGILSLISSRLGAEEVVGIDVCPHSIAVARRNVEANHLHSKITITDTPLHDINGKFDLILANLTASVFYRLQNDIRRCSVEGETRLIVSGLQGRQAEDVAGVLCRQGWQEEQRLSAGKWKALLFIRNSLTELSETQRKLKKL
jgi:ribosomal protein L11 methylase PrmA